MHSETTPAAIHFQLAAEHLACRRIAGALSHFDDAERLGFDPDRCASGRWECWMFLGDFERAWRESDSIRSRGAPDPNRFWDDLPFIGKRVILRCLHGLGDAIQFIRYALMIRRDATRLIVETHSELVSLFRNISSIDEVITWGECAPLVSPAWDQQIEVMELPRAFRTTVDTIPFGTPYLAADSRAIERSGAIFDSVRKPRIGLLWASSKWNPGRSMTLSELSPILGLWQFAFYSFQLGPERAQLQSLNRKSVICDAAANSRDIADTAAAMMHLDLVITVDTMAAHLAGSLGKQVWTLLPYAADWRWMLDTDRTPWYPSMRLFRQPSPGTWGPVIERVACELSDFR